MTDTARAGKSTKFMYLSKSTSKTEKSYSGRSKSTQKKLYLKYTQEYFYQPKSITLARLQHVTISQAFLLVCCLLIREEFLLAELLPGTMTCKRHRPTISENNNAKKQIAK